MRFSKHAQNFTLASVTVFFLAGCGDSFLFPSQDDGSNGELNQDYLNIVSAMVASMSISGNVLSYNGTTIANMNNNSSVSSPYGTFKRGQVLNVLNIDGVEFLIYGDKGAVAAECTPSSLDPNYGPSHPLCSTTSVEAFDRFVVCAARVSGVSVSSAQAWPGAANAFDAGKGMICWTNGIPENSDRMYTF